MLRTVYPGGMAPGQSLWALCLIWVSAFHAGEAFECCGAPKALGMLLAGLALRLLPGVPSAGVPPPLTGLSAAWSLHVRAGAMALIMLRTGLGLNVRTLMRYGWSFVAMCTLPALIESLLGAVAVVALFKSACCACLLVCASDALHACVHPCADAPFRAHPKCRSCWRGAWRS